MERPETLTIKAISVKHFIDKVIDTAGEETEISLEVMLMNTFPILWKNMQEALNEEHTKGYIEGLKAGRENG